MRHNPSSLLVAAAALCLATAVPALAADYDVHITNATKSQISGPPIAITHAADFELFAVGAAASEGVAIMAEDAALATLIGEVEGDPDVADINAAGAPLLPGESVIVPVVANGSAKQITVAQMLVTTNDTFWAVHNVELPRGVGQSVVYYAEAYDAGSEENTELCATIPGPPCGSNFVRDQAGAEGFVYVSNGIHGIGDLPPATWDWRNPTVRVEITRTDSNGRADRLGARN